MTVVFIWTAMGRDQKIGDLSPCQIFFSCPGDLEAAFELKGLIEFGPSAFLFRISSAKLESDSRIIVSPCLRSITIHNNFICAVIFDHFTGAQYLWEYATKYFIE